MQPDNHGWFYAKFPEENGELLPESEIFEVRPMPPLPKLAEGKVRVRLSLISVAPMAKTYLELPGNNTGADELGLQRTTLGSPLQSESIAVIVESKSPAFAVGDLAWVMGPLIHYRDVAVDGSDGIPPLPLAPGVRPEHMLSVVTPSAGITAYCAVEHHPCGRVEKPYSDRTVLVTSAAGAVGIVVGQLYKNKGCRVIGVTSTREKADRLEALGGYDSVIAYKSEDLDERLSELAPAGIDVFIDNVGAAQLDAGTRHMKIGGTMLSIGAIAEMDAMVTGEVIGMKEYLRIPARELTFGGMLMYNHLDKIPEAAMALSAMLADGRLTSAETVVNGQFADWAECVTRVYQSDTFGRLILSVDHEANVV